MRYHTFWNIVNVTVRLGCASVACGIGSLVSGESQAFPRLGTVVGMALGDFVGSAIVLNINKEDPAF